MNRILIFLTLMLMLSTVAFADIARPDKSPNRTPKPRKSIETNLRISLKRDAIEARLIIPKSQIKELRAALDDLDQGGDSTAQTASSTPRIYTVVSGTFLSLALVFGGMLFFRRSKDGARPGKTVVVVTLLAGIGLAATFVYANAGPPAEARSITGKMFSQSVHIYKFGYGAVKLETKDDATGGIELIVPDPPDKDKPKSDEE